MNASHGTWLRLPGVVCVSRAGDKWFELHSYCVLCGMMHKSPCELAYTKAMTAYSLFRDGEFPEKHTETYSSEFLRCGPRHAAFYAAQAEEAGAAEQGNGHGNGEEA